MKPIRFDYTDDKTFDRYHYLCDGAGDMSGEYYSADVVEALVTALRGTMHFTPFLSGYYKAAEQALKPFK